MEIKKKYLSKYLHDIAIEQIVEDYIQKGYTVNKEEKLGKYRADVIARKGNEQIVIEVKAGKMTPDKKKKLSGIADYIRDLGGYKFLVVIATPPKEKKLEIDNIEQLISNYILNDLPSELDELSSHTRPDDVTDVDIDEITISENTIFIKGDGVVSVELQFGSDGDNDKGDGLKTYDNFPFEFEMTLEYNDNKELEIIDVDKFEIDTSSYYDN
jgi:Holliday junction resolvase